MALVRNALRRTRPPQLLAERVAALDEAADGTEERALAVVEARKALMSRSVAKTVTASNGVVMNLSGAALVRAGDDLVVNAGGAAAMVAGGDLHMEGGGSGVIVAKDAHVENGFVGMLLARKATVGDGTRVLVTTREALIIGLLVGALFPLTRYLLRRFAAALPERQRETPRDAPAAARLGRWLLGRAIRLAIVALVGWLAYRWAMKKAAPVLGLFGKR